MRGMGGYGGPISHWWESCLLYCGAMADWRYEGILSGYITLYRQTSQGVWLARARQAAEDVLAAQLPGGNFRNSAFQQGPMEAGTPHEAAIDVGLLELAHLLREEQDEVWGRYMEAARQNITQYVLGRLWNGKGFTDQPTNTTLVPNKNATVMEALILYETLSGEDMSRYLDSIAEVICSAQEQDGPRQGGIIHRGTGQHQLTVGIYTARASCGLLRFYERSPNDAWLAVVQLALSYLRGLYSPRGTFFGHYRDAALVSNPRIIAGAGDILRVMAWGQRYGLASADDVHRLVDMLLQAQHASGGIPTAYGFGWRGRRGLYQGEPEFRDVLPVVGWADKAFRALALLVPDAPLPEPDADVQPAQVPCVWKNRSCLFADDGTSMRLWDRRTGETYFHWEKGTAYPAMYRL
jgi:hypothetical protein